MDEIIISVLVPVYKVEKFIERCAISLFNQTIQKGVEYIFVDDCTPDKSIEILNSVIDKYPNRKNQVKVIRHEENFGLMWARKTGYVNAKGKYIFFCDSDDFLPIDALEILYKEIINSKADIIIGDYKFLNSYGKSSLILRSKYADGNSKKFHKSMLTITPCFIWGNLYKSTIFKNINYETFLNQTLSEDRILFTQILHNNLEIKGLNKITYFYCQNNESSSRLKPTPKSQLSQIKAWNWLMKDALLNNYLINETKIFLINRIIVSIEYGWDKNLINENFLFYNDLLKFTYINKFIRFPLNIHYNLVLKSRKYSKITNFIRRNLKILMGKF